MQSIMSIAAIKYHGEFWVMIEASSRLWCSPVSFFLSFAHRKSHFFVELVLYSYKGLYHISFQEIWF